jgi:hypothetical protein
MIDGRPATVAYLRDDMDPCEPGRLHRSDLRAWRDPVRRGIELSQPVDGGLPASLAAG